MTSLDGWALFGAVASAHALGVITALTTQDTGNVHRVKAVAPARRPPQGWFISRSSKRGCAFTAAP